MREISPSGGRNRRNTAQDSKGNKGRKITVLVRTKSGDTIFPEKRPEKNMRAVDLLIDLVGSLKGRGARHLRRLTGMARDRAWGK